MNELGNATKRFSTHLKRVVHAHNDEVKTWGVPSRIKPHSCRKGSATHLTSGTLSPPPNSSVAHRGEWSQGKVQDIYFNFALPGDHYVGRILAGLDPNCTNFQVLPPHFTCGLENEHVKEGIEICYGRILNARKNLDYLPGICLLMLASIVYHEAWLKTLSLNNKKHPFSNLFFLENKELLKNLKELVTTKPTHNMSQPTGIPTHINLQIKMDQILLNNIDFIDQLKAQSMVIKEAIKNAIQDNDLLSGNVTMPILTEQLDNHHATLIEFMKKNFVNLSYDTTRDFNIEINANDNNMDNTTELQYVNELQKGTQQKPMYSYGSQF